MIKQLSVAITAAMATSLAEASILTSNQLAWVDETSMTMESGTFVPATLNISGEVGWHSHGTD